MAFWKKDSQPAPPPTPDMIERTDRRNFILRVTAALAGGAFLRGMLKPATARADGDPFLGEIALVPYFFAPTGWAFCDGQILPINQNQALFALLGTTYGGNGQTTFALPDLRGRVPLHVGSGPGPGLSPHNLGELSGTESVTLAIPELPAHSHAANASSVNGTSDTPTNALPAKNASGVPEYGASANTTLAPGAIGNTGSSQPHNNMQPYLGLNYIIAMFGIFPSRSTPARPARVVK